MDIWPGKPYPLGATFDGAGTNFSLFSEVAERVELCLFDADGQRNPRHAARGRRLLLARLRARASVPASATAIRVHGPWAPDEGHRCNPAKLLIDPYAKAIDDVVSGTRRCSATASASPTTAERR